ncbi:hypothetical protein LX36DRAFT_197147 [Colletotrichum falcatum]|nr:hypothetical protein LX36DRAFT_197147 [Colletotrichum falcatum]
MNDSSSPGPVTLRRLGLLRSAWGSPIHTHALVPLFSSFFFLCPACQQPPSSQPDRLQIGALFTATNPSKRGGLQSDQKQPPPLPSWPYRYHVWPTNDYSSYLAHGYCTLSHFKKVLTAIADRR